MELLHKVIQNGYIQVVIILMLSHNNTIITFDKTYGCTATDSAVQVEERLRVGRDIFHNLIAGVQSVIMIMYNVKQ